MRTRDDRPHSVGQNVFHVLIEVKITGWLSRSAIHIRIDVCSFTEKVYASRGIGRFLLVHPLSLLLMALVEKSAHANRSNNKRV